jgi:hypothetical protein
MRTRHFPWHVYPKPARPLTGDRHSNPFGVPWAIPDDRNWVSNFAGTPLGYIAANPHQENNRQLKCHVKAMLLGAVNGVTQLRLKWDKQSIDTLPGLFEQINKFAEAMREIKQQPQAAALVSEWYRSLTEEQKLDYHRIGDFHKRYAPCLREYLGTASDEDKGFVAKEIQRLCDPVFFHEWEFKIIDELNVHIQTASKPSRVLFVNRGIADIRPGDVKKLNKEDKATVKNVHKEIRHDLIPRYLFWRVIVETINAFKKVHPSDPDFAPCAVKAITGLRNLMPDIDVLVERAKEHRVTAPAFNTLADVRDRMSELGRTLDDPTDRNQQVLDMGQKERRAFYKAWTDQVKGRSQKPKSTRAPRKISDDVWTRPANDIQRQLDL